MCGCVEPQQILHSPSVGPHCGDAGESKMKQTKPRIAFVVGHKTKDQAFSTDFAIQTKIKQEENQNQLV